MNIDIEKIDALCHWYELKVKGMDEKALHATDRTYGGSLRSDKGTLQAIRKKDNP